MSAGAWYGVDLDGTLAAYGGWQGATHIGAPVEEMVARVREWLAQGVAVRIFTARVWPITQVIAPDDTLELAPPGVEHPAPYAEAVTAARAIQAWCEQHLGRRLPITCVKDYGMVYLYDDRAVRVLRNAGLPCPCCHKAVMRGRV